MIVDCIYAKDISCGRCVECLLGLYGGAPDIDICNNHCKKRITMDGEKIEKPIINTEIVLTGEEKFNTCSYRTENEISETRRTCCSSFQINGYKCNKLNIFPLNQQNCQDCKEYLKKN